MLDCSSVLTFFRLARWLQEHDRASYYGLRTVKVMQGEGLSPFVADILGFVNHRYRDNCLAEYAKRVQDLRQLQKAFEKTGAFPAKRYSDVKPIDDETYKLALLLSFICTNHRFEILKELVSFLWAPSKGPPHLLSIGYGTGYELKLSRGILRDWKIDAFDNSAESFAYAKDLLTYFDCGPVAIRRELFPLETSGGIDKYHGTFAKILLCELLEHLENPALALRNLRFVLHDKGHMFLTMAINIAQEDHVFLYSSVERARRQVLECGYRIVREVLAPAVLLPFRENEREGLFRRGNYICIVEKNLP